MATTTSVTGTFVTASGPTSGAQVDLWLASRFASAPAFNSATPTGSPDYGPVASGNASGAPGGFKIDAVSEGDYYVRAVFGGNSYWQGPISAVENSDVMHLTGNETAAGNKTFSGNVVINGVAATAHNTLDDGSGNASVAGSETIQGTAASAPDLVLANPDSGASTYTTLYGLNLDNNSAIGINAKAGRGVYTQADGVKKNVLDDGTGNMSAAGAITAATGLTVSSGPVALPAGSIAPGALAAPTGGAYFDTVSAQNITGVKTFRNDIAMQGAQIISTALVTPSAPVVTPAGATGSTTYYYEIVGTTYDGRDTIPSVQGGTTVGNAVLSNTNYNGLSWAAVAGVASYKVLRWNGSVYQLLASGITGTTYNDTGAATPTTYAASATNPGGEGTFTSLVASAVAATALNASAATVSGTLTVAGASGSPVPLGVMLPYAGSAAPTGWLLCDGTAVNRATYAALFALIGTTYGAGNGSTTFNVPNMAGVAPIGVGALGITRGQRDAVGSALDHSHYPYSNSGSIIGSFGTGLAGITTTGNSWASAPSTGTIASPANHNTNANLPPYLGVNYIIKT